MAMNDADAAWAEYQKQQQNTVSSNDDADSAWKAYQAQQNSELSAPAPSNKSQLIQSAQMASPLGLASTGFKALGQMLPSYGGILPSASEIGQRSHDFLFGGDSGYGTTGNIARTLPVGEAGALLRGAGALAKGAGVGGNILTKAGEFLNPATAKTLTSGIGKAALSGGVSSGGLTAADNVAEGRPAQDNVLQNAALGAGAGGALQGLFGAAGKGASALVANRLNKIQEQSKNPYSSVRTPSEANKILEAQKTLGTGPLPLDIGALTNQANYKSYHDVGAKFPFAGQQSKIQQVVDQTDAAANNVYNGIIKGQEPSAENILKKVIKTGKDIKAQTKKDYETLYKHADEAGIHNIETPSLQAISNTHLDQVKYDTSQGLPHMLEDSPKIMKLLERFKEPLGFNNPTPGMRDLNKTNTGGFKNLKEIRTKISDVGRTLDKRSPSYGEEMKILNQMKDAINSDIGYNIEKSSNPALAQEWAQINKNYVDKNVPLRDVADVIRGSKRGPAAINKVLNSPDVLKLLDPDTRELLGARKLIKSVKEVNREGENTKMGVNASRFVRGYSDLDITQKPLLDLLFTPQTQKKLEALKTLHGATAAYRTKAQPPETGAKLAGYLTKGVMGLGAAGVAGAAALSPVIAAKAALFGGAGLGLNRGILNTMSNPTVLKAYANPLFREHILKASMPAQNVPGGLNALINSLISQYPLMSI